MSTYRRRSRRDRLRCGVVGWSNFDAVIIPGDAVIIPGDDVMEAAAG